MNFQDLTPAENSALSGRFWRYTDDQGELSTRTEAAGGVCARAVLVMGWHRGDSGHGRYLYTPTSERPLPGLRAMSHSAGGVLGPSSRGQAVTAIARSGE